MSAWFKKVKGLLIALGIVYVLLALFLVSAYTKVQGDNLAENDKAGNLITNLFSAIMNIQNVGDNFSYAFSEEGQPLYIEAFKWYSMIYGIGALFLLINYKTDGEYKDIEHGSAKWAAGEEYDVLSKTEGFILGDKHRLPVIPTPPNAKNGNILVIGGSGSGKSASFAIPNAFQMLGSYIFTDPKGELYDRTAGIFKKNGYEIHVVNLADPKYSDGYNPLSHIRNSTDVDIIAKIISNKDNKGPNKGGDPFWDQTSEALLKALMYYVLLTRPKEEHSLASCLSLVRLGGENEGEDLMNLFMDLPFENPARRAFETIRLGSEKTFSNILVSLAAKLEAFDSQEIAALTASNTIEFEDLASRRSVVYFITPESHSTYDFLMNIFFSQLFQRLYEFGDQHGGSLPVPMFLILDEFANIGRIPNFERILSTCRSKKLHISIILQSLDQLDEIYDEKVAENIKSNCSTHLFLGTNALKTLETFSKQLGERTISRDNVTKSEDKDNHTSGHSYSDQIMGRALMTVDELRTLNKDDCIIVVQGLNPIRDKKYWYYKKHPLRDEAKAAEISHLSAEELKRGDFKITNPYELIQKDDGFGMPSFDDVFAKPSPAKEPVIENNVSSMSNSNEVIRSTENTYKENMQNEDSYSEDQYDLQAALEASFDKLFGTPSKKNTYND